ncbi:hypothetical protein Syun_010838 [Stephania yunnanensis]|uniref:Uncharacterized protein n=1 Tax=Stephania yunnanensis TaxID=152371 RepID=A0AAP0JXR2_9MAGN
MSMQGQAYIPLRRFPYLLPSVVNLFKNSLVSLPPQCPKECQKSGFKQQISFIAA